VEVVEPQQLDKMDNQVWVEQVVLEHLIQLMLAQHLFLSLHLQVEGVVVVVQQVEQLELVVVELVVGLVVEMEQLILVVAVVELETVDQVQEMVDQEL
tara:strand:- start:24 stop:317 length:294 start_codon:yes stop_codon:yes gene_type:complete